MCKNSSAQFNSDGNTIKKKNIEKFTFFKESGESGESGEQLFHSPQERELICKRRGDNCVGASSMNL